ncbi:hypothetical protein SDC9_197583 [bioreactor metagenome]|uniref:Uncharacterized protein n=1 Tax=bioreactor metagenome TaxID=1076179 RepID=A0A645IHK6_9ZZZZ
MARAAGPPPDGSTQRRQNHRNQEWPGHLVGQLRQARLLQRGAFHQRHHLRKPRAIAYLVHSHLDGRAQVVAAGTDR